MRMIKEPYKGGRGFITEYLPDFPGDWECLEDFCGTTMGSIPLNVCAWWSPSKGVTSFGGQWWEAPDLPYKVGEQQCWKHGMAHSLIGKHIARTKKIETDGNANMAHTDRIYKTRGENTIVLELRLSDGTPHRVEGPCGIRGTLTMLHTVSENIKHRGFKGAVIKRLKVTNSKGNPTTHDLCLSRQSRITGRS